MAEYKQPASREEAHAKRLELVATMQKHETNLCNVRNTRRDPATNRIMTDQQYYDWQAKTALLCTEIRGEVMFLKAYLQKKAQEENEEKRLWGTTSEGKERREALRKVLGDFIHYVDALEEENRDLKKELATLKTAGQEITF